MPFFPPRPTHTHHGRPLPLLLLGLSWIQQACGQQITIESPANGASLRTGQWAVIVLKLTSCQGLRGLSAATTSSVQTLALSLGLKAAALSHLVLKTLYASDLHINLSDYSYRFLHVLGPPNLLLPAAHGQSGYLHHSSLPPICSSHTRRIS
ncbi:hypothetical protein PTTG_11341, partial [Puccinia triticina 1-1 BBBD Race 1]